MSPTPTARAALRSLLRVAHKARHTPDVLVPLLNRAPRIWNPEVRRAVSPPFSHFVWCEELLRSCVGGATEYALPQADRRCARAVRQHWHLCHNLGVDYLQQAREALARLEKAQVMASNLRDEKDVLPEATRWRLTWCAPSEDHSVEVGDLLMTHPLSGLFQEVFDQAVLLVVEIDQDEDLVKALVLNKASEKTLGQRETGLPRGSADFMNEILFKGGPMLQNNEKDLWWLHSPLAEQGSPNLTISYLEASSREPPEWPTHQESTKRQPPLQKISGSGSDEIHRCGAKSLRLGLAAGGDLEDSKVVRFFEGCAAWAVEQLQIELQRGVWVHARPGFHRSGREALHQLALEVSGEKAWRQALLAANFPALASFPRNAEVDPKLQDYVTAHQRKLAMELLQQKKKGVRLHGRICPSQSKVIFNAPEGDSISAFAACDSQSFSVMGTAKGAVYFLKYRSGFTLREYHRRRGGDVGSKCDGNAMKSLLWRCGRPLLPWRRGMPRRRGMSTGHWAPLEVQQMLRVDDQLERLRGKTVETEMTEMADMTAATDVEASDVQEEALVPLDEEEETPQTPCTFADMLLLAELCKVEGLSDYVGLGQLADRRLEDFIFVFFRGWLDENNE
eukprot:symbB.v1.2.020445.t2/scaffold1723.1/size104661/1